MVEPITSHGLMASVVSKLLSAVCIPTKTLIKLCKKWAKIGIHKERDQTNK